MTINSETRVAGPFEGNDSTVAFPFTFKVFDSDEVLVVRATDAIETVLTLGADYSVALNPDQNASPGGDVTLLLGALATGSTLTLTSDLEFLQPLDLTNQGGFYPRVINNAFDRVTILLQQLAAIVGRTLKFPLSDGPVGDLPGRSARAGTVLAFNVATGEPEAGPDIGQLGTVAAGIAAIGTVASNIADVNTVASNIADVNTVVGNIADVNTVAGNIAAIGTVASNIADVNTVADNLADVSSFAGVYYGPSVMDPTTRRDGSPLLAGDLYFNTATDSLRAYNGTAWRESVSGAVTVQNLSGDGVETEFPLNYAPESEIITQVYISGVYQQKNTYSLGGVGGATLVFDEAPPTGTDNIEIVVSSLTPSDDVLRADLADSSDPAKGAVLVAGAIALVASIKDLATATQVAGRVVFVGDYHAGVLGGGGSFAWDAAKDRALHNGGTVIDPTRVFPTDWTNQTQVTAWFTPAAGSGCWVRKFDGALDVRWFGAKGDSTADDTKAVQKSIDQAVALLLAVYVSPGVYRTTAQLTIPQNAAVGNAYGVSIYGDNASWQGVSVFYAEHTGAAILSLKGANGCLIEGLKFVSHATTFPKCALVLGRDVNVDSCGWHTINRIWIDGMYSKAAIYSIASEENRWSDIFIQLRGGGALYGFYTGISDALTVDSLPTSSNVANSVTKMNIWNWVNDTAAACVYIEGAEAVGSWSFTDCYCIPKSGSYYQINIGAVDGLACLGPFTFIGCSGEIYDPVSPYLDSPLNGFKISSPGGALDVRGLTILGSRCQLINAASTRKILSVASNLTLVKPNIVIQPLEDPTTTYTAIRNKIKAGIFDVANSSSWIPLTFSGAWGNLFGAPYATAALSVDNSGILSLRGTVTNSSAGVSQIAQLPPGYEPAFNMFFTVSDGSAIAKILVNTAGAVTLNVGTGASVDLSNVRFRLVDA